MIRINLLSDRNAKDRQYIQQQITLGLMALAALLAISFLWYQSLSGDISRAETNIASAKKELKKQEIIRNEIRAMEAKKKRLENIKIAIENLNKIKSGPTIYLDHINVLLPKDVWLTQISDSEGRLTLQGFSFSNTSVAQFMTSLEDSDQFVDISLKEITKAVVGKRNLKRFTVNCWTALGKKLADEKAKRAAEAAAAKKKKK